MSVVFVDQVPQVGLASRNPTALSDRPEHRARQSALVDIIRKDDISADNSVLDAGGSFDQAGLFARQIVDPLGRLRTDRLGIENDQVRIQARSKTALPGLIEKPGRL